MRRHPDRRELEELELPAKDWRRILESARASGLGVVAEAYDRPSRDVALAAGVSALLSHATDVDHPELLKALGGGGVPVLLATGGADDAVVRDALAAAGGEAALVLGPADAPAPVEELRLSAIAAARERFRTSVGRPRPDGRRLGVRARRPRARGLARRRVRPEAPRARPRRAGPRRRGGALAGGAAPLRRAAAAGRSAPPARRRPRRRAGPRSAGARSSPATLIARGDVLTAEQLRFKRTPERADRGLRPSEARAGHRPARRAPHPGRRGDPRGHARMTARRP